MTLIRTLLVDDSPEFIEAAIRFLSLTPWIKVVGYATSGKEALEKNNTLKPDLVLMDLAMPEMNGLQATRQVKAISPVTRVIILTLHDNLEYRSASRAVQADGFIAKSDFGVELVPEIQRIFAEEMVLRG